jgi:dTDP-4-amino-4,6-dideoxygalactose transaminase
VLTLAPSPSWKLLAKTVLFPLQRANPLLDIWSQGAKETGLLSRGTWAFMLIATWRAKNVNDECPIIYFPDYFCRGPIDFLEKIGWEVRFYNIKTDLSCDLPALRSQFEAEKPSILVMVNFFGKINSQVSQLSDLAKSYGSWLVEDCAHCLLPEDRIGRSGDFAIFNPYKFIATPSGCVLRINPNGPSRFEDNGMFGISGSESWSDQAEVIANRWNLRIVNALQSEMIWVAKRLAQRFGLFRKPFAIVEDSGFQKIVSQRHLVSAKPGLISRICIDHYVKPVREKRYFRKYTTHIRFRPLIETESRRRALMSRAWETFIQAITGNKLMPDPWNGAASPPYASIFIGNDDVTSIAMLKLQTLGIPATSWPDFPEQIRSEIGVHEDANELAKTRIYLPLHLGILPKDIKKVLDKFVKINTHRNDFDIGFAEIDDKHHWSKLLEDIEYCSHLQAWGYGQAKLNAESFSVSRVVITNFGQNVGVVQILTKTYFKVLRVNRISRGPLFFNGVDGVTAAIVLNELKARFGIKKSSILSIEVEKFGNESLYDSVLHSFRAISLLGFETVLIDLSQDADVIRKNLHSSWRNQLKKAESSSVQIFESSESEDFEFFKTMYLRQMSDKGFIGIDEELLDEVYSSFLMDGAVQLFIAKSKGSIISGALILTHGKCATYFASWNSDDGRDLNAMNLILWEAVTTLKQKGCTFFDLGGIDLKSAPSVGHFKIRMGGAIHRTYGEYLVL